MGGYLLLAIHLLVLETSALTCRPREYPFNNICCPMCDKGSFVKSHCTSESSSSVCVICADNTYMDHPSGLTECFRCSECDSGAGRIVKERCTSTSNTVCECKAGYFCLSQDCDFCQEYKECQPGEYVKKPGTERTDAECEKCPQHHFSNKNNSAVCLPWQECPKLGLFLYKEGTSTTDSICREKRSREGLYAILFCPVILAITLSVTKAFRCLKPKEKETVEDHRNALPLSTEEVPIQSEFDNENSQRAEK